MNHDKGYHNHPSPTVKLVAQRLEQYVNRLIMIYNSASHQPYLMLLQWILSV